MTLSVPSAIRSHLLRGGAWAVSAKVLGSLAVVGVNALLARLLTPTELGVYFLAFTVVAGLAVLGQLGLTQTAVRLVSEARANGDGAAAVAVIRRVALIGAATSCLVASVLVSDPASQFLEELFHNQTLSRLVGLMAVWTIVTVGLNLTAESFRGLHDIRTASVMIGLATPLLGLVVFGIAILSVGQIRVGAAVGVMAVATAVPFMIGAGVLLLRLSREPCPLLPVKARTDSRVRRILTIGCPLLVHNLASFAVAYADVWVVGIVLTAGDVALYGAAARLVAVVHVPLLVANSVLPPIISEMYTKRDLVALEGVLRATASVTGAIAGIGLVAILVFPVEILGLIYGDAYVGGATVLVLLGVARTFSVVVGSSGVTLTMTGHERWIMICSLVIGSLAVAGAVVLAGTHGIVGVAAVMAAGLIVQNVTMLLLVRSKVGIWTHAKFSLKRYREDVKGS